MSIYTETYSHTLPPSRGTRVATIRHKNQLIFDLVHGIAGLQDEVIDEARSLRMDLSQPRAVILVDASDYVLGPAPSDRTADRIEGARARSREVIASIVAFFMLPHEAICADLGDGMIVVLKA